MIHTLLPSKFCTCSDAKAGLNIVVVPVILVLFAIRPPWLAPSQLKIIRCRPENVNGPKGLHAEGLNCTPLIFGAAHTVYGVFAFRIQPDDFFIELSSRRQRGMPP